MTNVHFILGTAVLIVFLISLVINLRTFFTGSELSFQVMIPRLSGTLLLAQWALGFGLLTGGNSITAVHWLLGLSTFFTVGFEHSYAMQQESAKERGKFGAIANLGTLILAMAAYEIGRNN